MCFSYTINMFYFIVCYDAVPCDLLHRMFSYLISCSFDQRAFRWMMTMVFTVEEINRNLSLLPGVKLGYRLMDSCDHVHTSLQAFFSLISRTNSGMSEGIQMEAENRLNTPEDRDNTVEEINTVENTRKKSMLTTDVEYSTAMTLSFEYNGSYGIENIMEKIMDSSTEAETLSSCLAGSLVPAVIGLASSSPTRAVAQTLGPFSVPLVKKKLNKKIILSTFLLHELTFLLTHKRFLINKCNAQVNVPSLTGELFCHLYLSY